MNAEDIKLAMWLEDELEGEELAAFESAMDHRDDLIAKREKIRCWKSGLKATTEAEAEPPYPEFFNNRLEREIRILDSEPGVPQAINGFSWRQLFMPLAACAGMVFAFWIGTKTGETPKNKGVAAVPEISDALPVVYTPEQGVSAELFSSDKASAMVVVLEGVAAIPDSIDFSETAAWRAEREADSTAGLEEPKASIAK